MNARTGTFNEIGAIGRIIREFTPVRAVIHPPVRGESSCNNTTCETHDLDLFCGHDTMVRSMAESGVLVFVAALAASGVGLASWILALHMPGAFYILAALVAVMLTNVVFWRAPAQRKAATLQVAAAFVAVGAGVRFGFGAATIGVAAGLALLSIVSLVLGALTEPKYGLRNVFRLAVAGMTLLLVAVAIASTAARMSHSNAFIFSSLGAAFGFAAGFVPEAVARAMSRIVRYVAVTPRARSWDPKPITKKARKLPGAFVIVSVVADQLVVGVNAAIRGAAFALSAAYRSAAAIIRELKTRLGHFLIRLAQTLLETRIGIATWWVSTADMLDHKLLPSTLPLAAFGAAAGLSLGAAHLASSYVGSGDGFAAGAWIRLAAICGVGAGVTIAFVTAWASFGEPFPQSVSSMSRSATHLIGSGLVIVGAYALANDFGLPVTHQLPVIDGFASDSPYRFGPVAALTLIGAIWLVVWLYRSPEDAPRQNGDDGGGLKEWIKRLKDVVAALELQRLTVPLLTAVAVVASLVVGTASLIDGR